MSRLKLGVVVSLRDGPDEAMEKVRSLGLPTCQVTNWDPDLLTPEVAAKLSRAARERSVEITTLWAGFHGRMVWDFVEGPLTIGLVPTETRQARVETLKRASDFAALLGVPSVTTHVGFIPENPNDPEYPGVVQAIREAASYCARQGQEFWFETGQETPVTLLRTIEDVGTGNLGVNLDPANLILYGKANPVDALDVFGTLVRGVHAKDGEYPTNGRQLGKEKPLGEGRVDFPALIARLKGLGYSGALTIEREVRGPEQIAGIQQAIRVLTPLLD